MKIGEMLVQQKKVSERDIERALLAQKEMGGMLGQVIVKLGLVAELDIARALSKQLDIPLLSASDYPDDPLIINELSQDFLFSNNLVAIAMTEEILSFAATVPQDPFLLRALKLATGKQIELCLGLESDINAAIQRTLAQEEGSDELDPLTGEENLGDDDFIEHLRDLASEAPVIRLVNQLIHRALDLGASDIHLEPFDDGLHLRYRVDGVIQDAPDPPPLELAPALASRIKLLAHLNIAERRLPQDGRIMTRVKGHELDLRVSTVPTVHGESIVMRVLDRESIRLSLESMGFAKDTLVTYNDMLARPHGILLVTGPTGSGKTTTLYASLSTLNAEVHKIITVEDPVEYQLRGVNQIQVQPGIELDFARALRSILRQDPDIIMIGEMRDAETAQIAVQSALTGHLVLSTLHTNTATSAITRLEDMGIERYLITSSVNGVLAQRLVRTLCPTCRQQVELTDQLLDESGLRAYLAPGQRHIYRSQGCPSCQQRGYSGRTAIHELFVMGSQVSKAIMEGADASTLHSLARKRGMRTLYEDGLHKVAQGVTSLEELLRVTRDQQDELA